MLQITPSVHVSGRDSGCATVWRTNTADSPGGPKRREPDPGLITSIRMPEDSEKRFRSYLAVYKDEYKSTVSTELYTRACSAIAGRDVRVPRNIYIYIYMIFEKLG